MDKAQLKRKVYRFLREWGLFILLISILFSLFIALPFIANSGILKADQPDENDDRTGGLSQAILEVDPDYLIPMDICNSKGVNLTCTTDK